MLLSITIITAFVVKCETVFEIVVKLLGVKTSFMFSSKSLTFKSASIFKFI